LLENKGGKTLINKINNKIYLITGVAGFIGFFLAKRLLEQDCQVIGIDNMNGYYDVSLKKARLDMIRPFGNFDFIEADICDKNIIIDIFKKYKPNIVINLAAQAGVRYSVVNPDTYIQSNIIGFFNILDACRHNPVEHLIYASSSSVYGSNEKVPFEETDFVDHPVSLYAATKKSNELMAYTYSHLYKIPATGLRFFTVYGPMGRHDMAYFRFTDNYFKGEPIRVFNNGDLKNDLYRDFTYIDDIVEGIIRLICIPSNEAVPHRVFNIGNNKPVRLMFFITTLEKCLSKAINRKVVFKKIFEPIQPGDIKISYASTDLLKEVIEFKPNTSLTDGLQKFADWYVDYYKIR